MYARERERRGKNTFLINLLIVSSKIFSNSIIGDYVEAFTKESVLYSVHTHTQTECHRQTNAGGADNIERINN